MAKSRSARANCNEYLKHTVTGYTLGAREHGSKLTTVQRSARIGSSDPHFTPAATVSSRMALSRRRYERRRRGVACLLPIVMRHAALHSVLQLEGITNTKPPGR